MPAPTITIPTMHSRLPRHLANSLLLLRQDRPSTNSWILLITQICSIPGTRTCFLQVLPRIFSVIFQPMHGITLTSECSPSLAVRFLQVVRFSRSLQPTTSTITVWRMVFLLMTLSLASIQPILGRTVTHVSITTSYMME